MAPLPGQHAKLSAADVAHDGIVLGGSYFAALLVGQAPQTGQQEVPELLPLAQAALDGGGSGGDGGGGRLAAELLLAVGTRLGVLHQQQQYWAHLCPVELLEDGDAEASGRAAASARVKASVLDCRVSQQEAQAELSSLATLVAQAAAGADARALALAVRSAPALQQWAPKEQQLLLLRACLQLAAAPAASQEQALALQLLGHPDLLEWGGLREALPAAAAAELHALLA